jgi:hypothetical protein
MDLVSRTDPRKSPPPEQEVAATQFVSPSFEIDDRVPTQERWLWAIPIVLALGIAAFMLYQRRAPNTSIALQALHEAQTVQLTWDANARAVRDSDHGEIEINDGGKNSQVSLNSDQLHAGKMSYVPQSSDVSFAVTVYPMEGDPIHDSTRLILPAFSAPAAPTQPPQLLPAAPAPPASEPAASAPAAAPDPEHDALEKQVQQLKEDLGKERARADELQNLVRILENRLGIPHEAPRSTRRPH